MATRCISLFTLFVGLLAWGCAQKGPPAAAVPVLAPPTQLAPFSPGTAAPGRQAKLEAVAPALDAFFAAKFEESGATGFAVGLILEGELAYQRGFGVRDVASGTPVDSDTVFRIASMTKSFTALSVLKLRDEGRVGLDAPAATYLPELRSLVPPTRDAPPISLRLLLSNASGLAYDDLWGAVTFGKSNEQLGTLLRGGVQITTAPGTKYAYSNLGWALLGKVVERVSGLYYRDYVTQNILRPLGMNSSAWEPSDVAPARLATGYRRDGDQLVSEPRPSDGVFAAAGGLYTSLHDYARYAAYQLAAYPPRDDPESGPVRRSTLREMHEGQRWARGGDKDAPIARLTDDGIVLGTASYGFGWLNVTSCTEEGRLLLLRRERHRRNRSQPTEDPANRALLALVHGRPPRAHLRPRRQERPSHDVFRLSPTSARRDVLAVSDLSYRSRSAFAEPVLCALSANEIDPAPDRRFIAQNA